MRVAVYGAGAVGCVFGAALAKGGARGGPGGGHEVVFIARGRTLEAIREHGVRVRRGEPDTPDTLDAPGATATDDPASVGPVDLVLVCVKAWQVPEVALAMRPLVEPGRTSVIPLQNGVDAPRQLAEVLGPERVLPGSCRVICETVEPGVASQSAFIQEITFGPYSPELEPDQRPRIERIAGALRASEIAAAVPEDIWAALWWKFAFISTLSGLGAVTRMTTGELRTHPETRELVEACLAEIVNVGRARAVGLGASAAAEIMAFIDTVPAGMTTSMQRDWQAGRPSELEAQPGAVVRLGREAGVPTPVSGFCWRVLSPGERVARGG